MHPFQQFCSEIGLSCLDYQGYGSIPCLGVYFDSTVITLKQFIKEFGHKHDKTHLVISVMKESKTHDWGAGCVLYFPNVPFLKKKVENE